MRSTLIAFSSIGLLAVVLAACGGGGSGSAPSAIVAPGSPAAIASGQGVIGTTSTGPTSSITLSIKIPQHTAPSSALHAAVTARFGAKSKTAFVRSIMNTSPTAAVRAWGAAMNTRAKAAESTRSTQYVSPSVNEVELVLASGSTVEYDEGQFCSQSGSTCTVSFYDVPVGTNYTAAIYLADDCDYITSAGTATGVNVTTGTNPTLAFTALPVVAYLDVASTYQPVSGIANGGFQVTVTPLDAESYAITGPGNLLDPNFDQINTITLTPTTSDVSPAGTTPISVPTGIATTAPYVLSQTYTSSGPGSVGTTEEWDAAIGSAASSPTIPNFDSYTKSNVGNMAYSVQVEPPQIDVIQDPMQAIYGYQVTNGSFVNDPGQTTVEVGSYPTPNPVPLYLAVVSNFNDAGATLQLVDGSNTCEAPIFSYNDPGLNAAFPSPGPTMPASLSYSFTVNIAGPTPPNPPVSTSCSFIVNETTNHLNANTTIGLDTVRLSVNGAKRK